MVFCAPLKQLIEEHVSLRKDMDTFYDIAEEIEFESGPEIGRLFPKLFHAVKAFTIKLDAHSTREEEYLFPMIARHLGENDRTIEVMEYEHEKAEQHLHDFLTRAERMWANFEENDAQAITVCAVQAYATLTQHFAKEENNLFPLAETLLSDVEKCELEQLLKETRTDCLQID